MNIAAKNLHYRQLNAKIYDALKKDVKDIFLSNVNGQSYIASGVDAIIKINIDGLPGDDLGAFMNGPDIFVDGNAQDAIGNTMSGGRIIINGHAGDAAGYSMRGGKIFIRDYAGYRVGIHMKQYREMIPTIVIGGFTKDFLGEYMAGGIIILLGIGSKTAAGKLLGTGMHGGVIYAPSKKIPKKISKTLAMTNCERTDLDILNTNIDEFIKYFKPDKKSLAEIRKLKFKKLTPSTHRPYSNLYAY